MRVLIADDEPLCVGIAEAALQCIPRRNSLRLPKTGKEALALIRQFKPDVAILDIQMPAKSGFDVIESLRPGEHVPELSSLPPFTSMLCGHRGTRRRLSSETATLTGFGRVCGGESPPGGACQR